MMVLWSYQHIFHIHCDSEQHKANTEDERLNECIIFDWIVINGVFGGFKRHNIGNYTCIKYIIALRMFFHSASGQIVH